MIRVRLLPAVTALVAWGALALQLVLIMRTMTGAGATTAEAIWRFLGYFTVLTNLLVAVVASAMALKPHSRLASPPVRLAAAAAIVLVGAVYSVALRALWSPVGLQAVADHALHDATPLLFAVTWLAAPHPRLRWRAALWATPWPLTYAAYALVRGAADGWYAYWFLDPSKLSPGQMATNVVLLTAVTVAIALLLVALDRALGRSRRPV